MGNGKASTTRARPTSAKHPTGPFSIGRALLLISTGNREIPKAEEVEVTMKSGRLRQRAAACQPRTISPHLPLPNPRLLQATSVLTLKRGRLGLPWVVLATVIENEIASESEKGTATATVIESEIEIGTMTASVRETENGSIERPFQP